MASAAHRLRRERPWAEGTASRVAGIDVWQWAWAPARVVDRDPAEPGRWRVLQAG